MMDTRIQLFDVAKGIGILLVLLGHSIPWGSSLQKIIYGFHMPLFFIVSGCLFERMSQRDLKAMLRALSLNLIIPYCFFLVLGAVTCCYNNPCLFDEEHRLPTLVSCLTGCPLLNRPLWFLHSLIVSEVVLWVFFRLLQGKRLGLLAISLLVISFVPDVLHKEACQHLPLNIFRQLLCVFFFIVGFCSRRAVAQLIHLERGWGVLWGVTLLVVEVVFVGICESQIKGMDSQGFGKGGFLATAFTGAGAVLFLSSILAHRLMGNGLAVLGVNSLFFFGLDYVFRPFVLKFVQGVGLPTLFGLTVFGLQLVLLFALVPLARVFELKLRDMSAKIYDTIIKKG